MGKIYVPFGTRDAKDGTSFLSVATDAQAKAATDGTKLLTADNQMQGAPEAAVGTLETMFGAHYQVAPANAATAAVLALTALADGETTTVTTGITDPDVPRFLSITGDTVGITGNVVITGTNFADEAIEDTIAANGTATVDGVKAFKTVTQIVLPAWNASGDKISVGYINTIGFPHIIAYAGVVLVQLFDGSTDAGTVTAAATLEKNVYAIAGTPNGTKLVDLYYLV